MLRSRRFVIGLLVTLVLLGLLIYQGDLGRTWEHLAGANYYYMLPGAAIYFLGVWFRAVRWRYLLMPLAAISSRRLYPIVVIGYMANDLLPAKAGELVRAYILGEKEGLSKLGIMGTIALERLIDGLSLLLLAGLAGLLLPLGESLAGVLRVTAGMYIGALILTLVLVYSQAAGRNSIGWFLTLTPARWRPRLGDAALRLGGARARRLLERRQGRPWLSRAGAAGGACVPRLALSGRTSLPVSHRPGGPPCSRP